MMKKIKEDIIAICSKLNVKTESVYTNSRLLRHSRIRKVIAYILMESFGYSMKEVATEMNKGESNLRNSMIGIEHTKDKHIKFLLKKYYETT